MSKVTVVYWSGTGHTEAMANAIAEAAGAECFTASEFDAAKVPEYDVIAFGCPSLGAEELEETEFAPMFEACKPALSGKKIALFGSWGWGEGAWMETWRADCEAAGAVLAAEPVMCQEEPDDDALAACRALGEAIK